MPDLLFEATLAWRYLAGARGQGTFSLLTVLALLGTLIGVAALVVGQAITVGIEANAHEILIDRNPHLWVKSRAADAADGTDATDATDAAEERSGAAAQIAPERATPEQVDLGLGAEDLAVLDLAASISIAPSPQPWFAFDEAAVQHLAGVPGLVSAHPVLEVDVFLNLGGRFALNTLRGASLAELQARGVALPQAPAAQAWALILPNQLLWSGDLRIGQIVPLVTAQLEATPVGRLPITQDFQILGTYAAPAEAPLLTTLATMQVLLNADGQISGLEVYVESPFELEAAQDSLMAWGEPVQVETWQERRSSVVAFLGILRLVMLVVLGLILLVAAFNIFAGQLMFTSAQRRAIALMRSLGFSQASVLRIFLMMGLFIGGVGALFGLGLGVLVAMNFPLFTQLGIPGLGFFAQSPPIIQLSDLFFAAAMALCFTFLASALPAWAAASTPPVEAIAHA